MSFAPLATSRFRRSNSDIARPAVFASRPVFRACEPEDLPQVARLFAKVFRGGRQDAVPAIERQLRDLLFSHPWRDAELRSHVSFAADDSLNGFIGALPMRMEMNGRPIHAAIASSLMVNDPRQNSLVGARLLRTFLNGPQDLSYSDGSSPIAVGMWERLGGRVAAAYSFDWIRLLEPAQGACALLGGRTQMALRPLARALDYAIAAKGRWHPLAPTKLSATEADPGEKAFQSFIIRLAGQYKLKPRWSVEDMSWILRQASHNKSRYGPLVCKFACERDGVPVGCFLYYARPKGVALVLQTLAEPGRISEVIDTLFIDAREFGCLAVRGRTQPELIPPLQLRHCYFISRSSSLPFKAKDRHVLAAIHSGDALLTGLSSESWTQLIGGLY